MITNLSLKCTICPNKEDVQISLRKWQMDIKHKTNWSSSLPVKKYFDQYIVNTYIIYDKKFKQMSEYDDNLRGRLHSLQVQISDQLNNHLGDRYIQISRQ